MDGADPSQTSDDAQKSSVHDGTSATGGNDCSNGAVRTNVGVSGKENRTRRVDRKVLPGATATTGGCSTMVGPIDEDTATSESTCVTWQRSTTTGCIDDGIVAGNTAASTSTGFTRALVGAIAPGTSGGFGKGRDTAPQRGSPPHHARSAFKGPMAFAKAALAAADNVAGTKWQRPLAAHAASSPEQPLIERLAKQTGLPS